MKSSVKAFLANSYFPFFLTLLLVSVLASVPALAQDLAELSNGVEATRPAIRVFFNYFFWIVVLIGAGILVYQAMSGKPFQNFLIGFLVGLLILGLIKKYINS